MIRKGKIEYFDYVVHKPKYFILSFRIKTGINKRFKRIDELGFAYQDSIIL